jgi:hypothetical protein
VPRREGDALGRERTVVELVNAATAHGLSEVNAGALTESIVGHLRRLVPDEVADVADVLPAELREFWTTAVPG